MIIYRFLVFVISIYLAITPSLVLANSYTGAVNFYGFNNFARTASGAVADFWFKNKNTAQVYAARAKTISNGALGIVARNRILRLSPQALIVGFAVSEVVTALTADNWIVEQKDGVGRIYRTIGGWCVRPSSFSFPTGSTFCADSPVAAAQSFIDVVNIKDRTAAKRTHSESGETYYLSHGNYDSPQVFGTFTDSTVALEVRANYKVSNSDGSYGPSTPFVQIFLDKVPTSEIDATAADVAAVLPNVSDSQIQSLVSTPDYAQEPHAPTIAAAAAAGTANPATGDCAGTSGTFNGTVFCVSDAPAGVQDNLSGETGTAAGTSTGDTAGVRTTTNTTTTTNPDGTTTTTETTTTTNPDGTATTQTKETTTHPDGTTTSTTTGQKASEMPAFCAYAQTLCDWIGWTKTPADFGADTDVPVEPADETISAADYQRRYFDFARTCPAPITIPISFMGASQTIELSYDPLCTMADKMRPVIILVAWIVGARIVVGSPSKGES